MRAFALFLPLLLVFVVQGEARGDVVVVGKREIHGELLEENETRVVIRVGDGILTLPRKSVKAVRREEELVGLIGEARALVKTLDPKALKLFDRALELA